jgi:putative ABC transport system substrate-binding protein
LGGVGSADPVADGLAASLARPGGNLTGINSFNLELMPKRLELLSDLVPQARVLALLADPNSPITEPMIRDVQEAARAKGVQLQVLKASSESEIDVAFATLVQLQVGGLLVGPALVFFMRREQIFALASRHAVPAMYDTRQYVAAGGLISYGPSLAGMWRQVGIYVGKILNGTKPADLPVQHRRHSSWSSISTPPRRIHTLVVLAYISDVDEGLEGGRYGLPIGNLANHRIARHLVDNTA